MQRVRRTAVAATDVPARSRTAAEAYAAGDVRWVVDLSQPPADTVRRRVDASRTRTLSVLVIVAAAMWLTDLLMLLHG
jgi:hypothetical protein